MARSRVVVPFGRGLDRESGPLVASPEQLLEAENVILRRGRIESRKGRELRSVVPGASYVVLIQSARSSNQSVIVAGEGAVGQPGHNARVYLGSGRATGLVEVGLWQNPTQSLEKVRATGAESGTRVFLAHDEPSLPRRAGTVYVDTQDAVPVLHPLTAEWANGGDPGLSDAIRFRGVVPWSEYLVGWGFWTNAEDRSEAVRISDPGDPTVFQDFAWKAPGQVGDPTVVCVPVDAGLLIYKRTELHLLRGSYSLDFELSQVEERFGVPFPRLTVAVGGTAYYWSLNGPRRTSGGPSEDLSWPLGLRWPTAADIAASGLLSSGFGVYHPEEQVVGFYFGTLEYLWDLRREEWTHNRSDMAVHSGGVLYPPGGFQGASRGYPDYSGTVVLDGGATVSWQNVSPEGDEVVELYLRKDADAWLLGATMGVTGSASKLFPSLEPGAYDVALRYRRQGLYSAGWTGSPDTWPAASRGSFVVPVAPAPEDAPSMASAVWQRTGIDNEQVALQAVLFDPSQQTEVWRGTTTDPLLATLVTTLGPGVSGYSDTSVAGETVYYYFVRHFDGVTHSAFSLPYRVWTGPFAPELVTVESTDNNSYDFTYTAGIAASGAVEHWDNHASSSGATVLESIFVAGVDGSGEGSSSPYRTTVTLKLRNRQVLDFGGNQVTDYSEFSPERTVEICFYCGGGGL